MQLYTRTTLALLNTLLAAQATADKLLINVEPFIVKNGEADVINYAVAYSAAAEPAVEVIAYQGDVLDTIEDTITAYETAEELVGTPEIYTIQTNNADRLKTTYLVVVKYVAAA